MQNTEKEILFTASFNFDEENIGTFLSIAEFILFRTRGATLYPFAKYCDSKIIV